MRHHIEHGRPGKHCHNCAQLEWIDGDEGGSSGWVCNKREYKTTEEENRHYAQLDREEYRFKGKRCHEKKDRTNG